jgi:hypothetical protein
VYIYRPADENFGYDRVYDLSINSVKVVELLHGGYFPFVTTPGNITAHAQTHFTGQMFAPCLIPLECVAVGTEAAIGYGSATVNLDVASGSAQYIRFHPITHAASFEPTLSVVSDDIALKELDGTKLLPPAPNK